MASGKTFFDPKTNKANIHDSIKSQELESCPKLLPTKSLQLVELKVKWSVFVGYFKQGLPFQVEENLHQFQ